MQQTIVDNDFIAIADNEVATFDDDFLKTEGGARMTYARIRVVAGVLEYAFLHDPNTDPTSGDAQEGAAWPHTPVDGFLEICGYDNLINFRYKRRDDIETSIYVSVGY